MYKKYKATFYAWKHSIMERKAAKFTELKKFLDEADETNDRLSDKVLEMEKEISRLQLIVKKFDEERDRKIEGEVHTTIDNMVAILILDAEATPPTKRTSFLASC
jgi:predicted  nucleic acid-binding Zn-ribbon protein